MKNRKLLCILCLYAVLLMFCGCSKKQPAEPEPTEEPYTGILPAPEESIDEVFRNDPFDISTGMYGSSDLTDPGSTAATWDLSKADNYPADDDATDMEFFEKWLAVEGITVEDLARRGCKQLIVTAQKKGYASKAYTRCYEQGNDGIWRQAESFDRMDGFLGGKGVKHDREQGDMTSPAGIWQLGTAFGNEPMPDDLKMPWKDITPNSDWVGDNDSLYYNSWQEKDDPELSDTWDGEEHLEDYDQAYALACVIRFNMYPYTRRYKGSAIFFHCSNSSTAGCVGLHHDDMKKVLLWMQPELKPYILISGYGK